MSKEEEEEELSTTVAKRVQKPLSGGQRKRCLVEGTEMLRLQMAMLRQPTIAPR